MKSKKELEELLKLYQAIIDNLPFDTWFKDENGCYKVINKSFIDYADKKSDGIIGKSDYDLYPKKEAKIYIETDLAAVESKTTINAESWLPNGMYKEEGKTPLFNEDGSLHGTIGFSRDITKNENIAQALRYSEKHFRAIFELAPTGMAIYDSATGRALQVNKAFCEILNRSEREIKEEPWWSFSHKDEVNENKEKLETLEEGTQESFTLEKRFVRPDNSLVWVNMRVAAFEQEQGANFRHICMIEDITERKLSEEKILYLSYYDQLTGVYNRHFYENELEKVNSKGNLPIALIMADVNGLKLINDAFGHLQGDHLLKAVSHILKTVCKDNGFVARIGGDEFVLILPNTDKNAANKIVKRIQDKLAKTKKSNLIFSVSFGWAVKESVGQSFKDVFKLAEDQMYKNKLSESNSMRSEAIRVITNTLYEKNEREQLHCERVSKICEKIGKAMKMSAENINELKTAGLLHDIGKVGIDEQILNKSGALTEEEWREMKRHPAVGFQILRAIKEFAHVSEYVLYHHERVDGKGYPEGLMDEDIPLQAKIICIADAYDAMTSVRTYKKAFTKKEAKAEILKNSGLQFDKEVANLFVKKVLITEI